VVEPVEPVPPASYLIRVPGALGPVVLTALGLDTAMCTHAGCTVLVPGTEDDIVEVVRRLLEAGVEIESVREIR
jgi:hypothetical protein